MGTKNSQRTIIRHVRESLEHEWEIPKQTNGRRQGDKSKGADKLRLGKLSDMPIYTNQVNSRVRTRSPAS